MESRIRGIFPIVYTPFDAEGNIDQEDLRSLVDYLIAAGTHGLAAVGGASECHKLTVAERKWLAATTIDAANGRVPIIVGVSATCTGDAVDLARDAESVGAVGVFATPPLYGPVTPDALEFHYGALARAVNLPILIQ